MSGKMFETALALRTMDPEQTAAYQVELLREHLAQAMRAPFYGDLLGAAGITPGDIHSLSDLADLPLTSRRDLDNQGDRFQAVPATEIVDIALTSGTTGPPVRVPYSVADLERLALNEALAFYGAGVRPGDICQIAVTLDRCFVAGLAYYNGLVRLGATAIRSGPGQAARQWELINSLNPSVLIGVPTFLLQVARWAAERGRDPAKAGVRLLVTIGEPVRQPDFSPTPLGNRLAEIWQCPVRSSYGATELETGFTECAAEQGGHIHPELSLVEIVNEEGAVLPDGEPGEMVVTPLGVRAFPLVRFRTGDITRKYTEKCGCGWTSARIGPVEGRLSQRLKMRGTTIYPETIFHVLQELKQIDASYIEVCSAYDLSDEIKVIVGSRETLSGREVASLLQARLRVRPEVVVRETGEVLKVMTRDGGRKPKRFFDLREETSR